MQGLGTAIYVFEDDAHERDGTAEPYGPIPEPGGAEDEYGAERDEQVPESEFHTLILARQEEQSEQGGDEPVEEIPIGLEELIQGLGEAIDIA